MRSGRDNGFDVLRVAGASMVIVSHAFPLCYGRKDGHDAVAILSNGQFTLGDVGVAIFFVISGYLVSQSFLSQPRPTRFLLRRSLRIFPGLIGALLFCTFVVGPIATSLPVAQYFADSGTYHYLANVFLYVQVYTLPGVFVELPYGHAVNGSLWTLPVEFLCYLAVLALGVFRLLRIPLLLVLYIGASALPLLLPAARITALPSFFAAGAILYLWRPVPDWRLAMATLFSLGLGLWGNVGGVMLMLSLPYLVYYAALHPRLRMPAARYGDLSYGLYLYGFPVQQLAVSLWPGRIEWYEDLVVAVPCVLVLAFLSWHTLEKHALRLKMRFDVAFA